MRDLAHLFRDAQKKTVSGEAMSIRDLMVPVAKCLRCGTLLAERV